MKGGGAIRKCWHALADKRGGGIREAILKKNSLNTGIARIGWAPPSILGSCRPFLQVNRNILQHATKQHEMSYWWDLKLYYAFEKLFVFQPFEKVLIGKNSPKCALKNFGTTYPLPWDIFPKLKTSLMESNNTKPSKALQIFWQGPHPPPPHAILPKSIAP